MDPSRVRISIMGKTILTPKQSYLVEQAAKNEEIIRWYYLTGGTALAEFYLHHRLSEDLDFFTTSEVNNQKIQAFIDSIKTPTGIKDYVVKQISGLYQYTLFYDDGESIKADFNEYDYRQVEPGTVFGKLRIDSMYDIAINKLESMCNRTKARDYVDLYMLISQNIFSMEQLMARVPEKFGHRWTIPQYIRAFCAAQEVTDYPTMLVPFDKEEMIDFYLSVAKKLGSKIFK